MTDPNPNKPKHFSMVRQFHLADVLTLGNAACGTAAIFAATSFVATRVRGFFLAGCALIFLALVFDVLDGRVARWRQKQSLLGRELDSLSDVISFGVAPAVMAYTIGMNSLLDIPVLLYFVACGVSRLARFNVTAEELSAGGDKVKYFEGTPIPTSLLLVVVLGIAAAQGSIGGALWFGVLELGGFRLHPLVLLFALSGSLMISRIRIPKL